jgi:hypothetical protein
MEGTMNIKRQFSPLRIVCRRYWALLCIGMTIIASTGMILILFSVMRFLQQRVNAWPKQRGRLLQREYNSREQLG